MRQKLTKARLGEGVEELKEFEDYKRRVESMNTKDGLRDDSNDGRGNMNDDRMDGSEGGRQNNDDTNDARETTTSEQGRMMDDKEPKMYEEELDDEWARTIREDEEAMEREMEQFQEMVEDTWLEKEEHELAKDKFGDG